MPALSNQDVARLFGSAAAVYDSQSNPYAMGRRARYLAALAGGVTIEVGGGTAAVLAAMTDRSRAFHSDIAEPMCRIARQKAGRASACFDAEQIPLADAVVDTVVSAEMIYYLRRPTRFIAEAHRILRPGGRLVLSTTNPWMTLLDRGRSVLRRLGFSGMFFDDGSPRFPSLGRLAGWLTDAGFSAPAVQGIVPFPFRLAHPFNRALEKTPFHRFGLFLVITARKPIGGSEIVWNEPLQK